jgi:hypothetical protein
MVMENNLRRIGDIQFNVNGKINLFFNINIPYGLGSSITDIEDIERVMEAGQTNDITKPDSISPEIAILVTLYDEKMDMLEGENKYLLTIFGHIIQASLNNFLQDRISSGQINQILQSNTEIVKFIETYKKYLEDTYLFSLDINTVLPQRIRDKKIFEKILIFAILIHLAKLGHITEDDIRTIQNNTDLNINSIFDRPEDIRDVILTIQQFVRKFFMSYYLSLISIFGHKYFRGMGIFHELLPSRFHIVDIKHSIINRISSDIIPILKTYNIIASTILLEIPIIKVSMETLTQIIKNNDSILQYLASKLNLDFTKITNIHILDIAIKNILNRNFNMKFVGNIAIDVNGNEDNNNENNNITGVDYSSDILNMGGITITDELKKYLDLGRSVVLSKSLLNNTIDLQNIELDSNTINITPK